jgi:hypothetical protein
VPHDLGQEVGLHQAVGEAAGGLPSGRGRRPTCRRGSATRGRPSPAPDPRRCCRCRRSRPRTRTACAPASPGGGGGDGDGGGGDAAAGSPRRRRRPPLGPPPHGLRLHTQMPP